MDLCASCLAGVVERSMVSCEKAANARRMFDFMSLGGSFDTLTQVCSTLSGMILASGAPLIGSALKRHLKSLCADSAASSSFRSSRGIQSCIRCTLSRNTQPPSFA